MENEVALPACLSADKHKVAVLTGVTAGKTSRTKRDEQMLKRFIFAKLVGLLCNHLTYINSTLKCFSYFVCLFTTE